MKKNRLLTSGIILCKIGFVLQCTTFLVVTVVFIHVQIAPDRYADVAFKQETLLSNSTFAKTTTETWIIDGQKQKTLLSNIPFAKTTTEMGAIDGQKAENPFTLNKMSTFSLYMNYIQFSAIAFLVLLILKEFITIITSVKLQNTFRSRNSKSFRKIGKYFLGIFILSAFVIVLAEQGRFYGFYIRLTPLIFTLAAYILGQIFNDGNALQEEHQFTI